MDLGLLYYHELESLCLTLFRVQGFDVLEQSGSPRDIGINFLLLAPTGERWAVVLKHNNSSPMINAQFRKWTNLLSDARDFLNADTGLLIFSSKVPAQVSESLNKEERLLLWDEPVLNDFLNQHADECGEYLKLLERQLVNEKRLPMREARSARAETLVDRLRRLGGGREHQRDFENLCIEILNYVFIPPFHIPKTQPRTENGAARRTVIYPLKYGDSFWDSLRSACQSHVVAAKFNNCPDAPTRADVESWREFLHSKPMISLGFLCTRLAPSAPAIEARRRAWLEEKKLIIFMSADDLEDMLHVKGAGGRPSEILELQLDELFASLI